MFIARFVPIKVSEFNMMMMMMMMMLMTGK
jgi:hypothetical protein